MNRYIASSLITCFLISIGYEWVYPGWDGYYLSKLLIIATLSCILWIKLPYSELVIKSLAFIVFLDAVWTIAQFLMNGEYQGSLELLNALIFLPWLAYAWLRSYEVKSDIPVAGKVFLAVHLPDDFWGFILSLKGKPVGGAGIWINGTAYSFHRGEFGAFTKQPKGAIFIETDIKQTEGIEAYLKSKVGDRWKWHDNCLTTLWKVKHG
ncbi:MAG: hypothetical protein ABUJ92_00560 [Desulfobacterales bacterium]